MKSIAIVNQKGGVGKTTTTVNLSTALVSLGKKVLIIDFDPQGNAGTGLGLNVATDRKVNAYDFLIGRCKIKESIKKTNIDNLDIIPSTMDLAAAEFDLFDSTDSNFILKNLITENEIDYDYIFIDCPPSLGLLTVNAMCFVDSVLIPMQCEFFALEGMSHLVKTYERIKKNFNSKLEIEGIVLTMYDSRNNLTKDVEKEVRNSIFGNKVYKTVIPRNVKVSEAPSFGEPILTYDISCSGAVGYINLAREFCVQNKVYVS